MLSHGVKKPTIKRHHLSCTDTLSGIARCPLNTDFTVVEVDLVKKNLSQNKRETQLCYFLIIINSQNINHYL